MVPELALIEEDFIMQDMNLFRTDNRREQIRKSEAEWIRTCVCRGADPRVVYGSSEAE